MSRIVIFCVEFFNKIGLSLQTGTKAMKWTATRTCLVVASVLTTSLLLSSGAAAFKVETHVWLADQIISELRSAPDGSIAISVPDTRNPIARLVSPSQNGRVLRTFTVPANVRDAILQYPETFRLGAIGPDALPGIIEGQSTIHPGGAKWGTGDWLAHVLYAAQSGEEIAFAYGMLAHAAGDVFAHTYVNHYAGNVFDLFDQEITVESRHMLLEGYIADHTPWTLSPDMTRGATANGMVRRDGRYAIPDDFLFRVFVESDEAAVAFSSDGSPHIRAVHNLYKGLGELTADGGPAEKLHKLVQKAIIDWTFDYNAKNAELKELDRIHQHLLDATNGAIDDLQDAHNKLRGYNRTWMKANFEANASLLKVASDNLVLARDAVTRKQEIEQELVVLHRKLEAAQDLPLVKKRICWHDKYSPVKICKIRKFVHESVGRFTKALIQKQKLEKLVIGEIAATSDRAWQALLSVNLAMLHQYDMETKILNDIIDSAQRFNGNANPIKGVIEPWRKDIKGAMIEYFHANTLSIGNSMTGGSMLDPLNQWLSCSALKIASIPGEIMDATCVVQDFYGELNVLLTSFKRIDPASNEIADLQENIKSTITKLSKEKALDYASSLKGQDFKSFASAITKPATAANLNDVFASAPAGTDLISAANMAEVIKVDMGVDANGMLQTERFDVARNALILMRLSLLAPSDINNVFSAGKVDSSATNIMVNFARSIDGDYQWMSESPPYARISGPPLAASVPYNYGIYRFKLFAGPVQRQVFRGIFRGPLAPGYLKGAFSEALPQNYTFRPTEACSFPNSNTVVICD